MPELDIIRPGGLLDYDDGLALQARLHADVVAGRSPGAVVICEHPPVYTAGRRTEPGDLPTNGAPVVEVDRGGRITWHGPGQLVAYPIVRLAEPLDVVAWVRDLEQVLIDVAASVGVSAERVDGRSGAWVAAEPTDDGHGTWRTPDARTAYEKVAAIGLHVAEGVTSHGIAINCDNALEPYASIVPCGIADAGVTTLSRAAGRHVGVEEIAHVVAERVQLAVDGMHGGARLATRTATGGDRSRRPAPSLPAAPQHAADVTRATDAPRADTVRASDGVPA